ncbi:unknown [Anaerotruncus sp. CAG:390]|nr:unknown [Anaerotruncus sp. CAG:390]
MVEQLVRAAAAAYDRDLGLKHAPAEVYKGAAVFFLSRDAIILGKPLKTGHHLIRLCDRVFAGVKLVLFGKSEDGRGARFAHTDYISGIVEVFFLTREVIKPHERLEYRH